ncbi:MAG: hypothetical protein DRI36_04370 [Caldiserica bacterium]|nr:MAG: hypothetical protein DRI36_04370 [Caldisericota bacterium]
MFFLIFVITLFSVSVWNIGSGARYLELFYPLQPVSVEGLLEPARIADFKGLEFGLSHIPVYEDTDYNFLGGIYSISGFTIGTGVYQLSSNQIESRDEEGNFTGAYDYKSLLIYIPCGIKIYPYFNFGLAYKKESKRMLDWREERSNFDLQGILKEGNFNLSFKIGNLIDSYMREYYWVMNYRERDFNLGIGFMVSPETRLIFSGEVRILPRLILRAGIDEERKAIGITLNWGNTAVNFGFLYGKTGVMPVFSFELNLKREFDSYEKVDFPVKPPQYPVAVIGFEGKGVGVWEAIYISNLIREYMVKAGFRVLEREKMEFLLAEQGFQSTGCTDVECAVKMGSILNVKKMVLGEVVNVFGIYRVSVRIVDVETSQIDFADGFEFQGREKIEQEVNQLIWRMLMKKGF